MWWSRTLLCLMVLALGPVGCGFQPIYARSGGAAASPMADHLASVRVAAIPERQGQLLRNSLVTSLSPRGEPASSRYVLTVELRESNKGLATSKDGTSTVGEISTQADFRLSDSRTGKTVYSGRTRALSGYRYLGPRYASTVSERESQMDSLTEIAAQIRGGLSAYFSDPATFEQRERERTSLPPATQPDPLAQESE